jgi:linoleoyl-CoA desaturase
MHFTEEEIEDESRAEWYLRQILGAANFRGGPLLHIMSGNLGFQIEHHLFPDLPSNRYAQISERVQALCEKYDIPYTTGPLHRQYGQALRTIIKLSVPNSWTSSDQPEPPTPPRDRKRKSDAERPSRRRELGGWSRSPRERSHDR